MRKERCNMRNIAFHFSRIWLSLSFARLVAPGFVLRFFLCIVSMFLASGFFFASLINANISLNQQIGSEKNVLPLDRDSKPEFSIQRARHEISEASYNNQEKQVDPSISSKHKLRKNLAPQAGETFSICCVSRLLLSDNDGDGYYSSFSITFDPDVSSGSADVYAAVYIRSGTASYQWLYTTSTFTITGDSGADARIVTTSLISNWPTGY